MKLADRWTIFGMIIVGLTYAPSPLRAQPAGLPAPTGDTRAPDSDVPAPPSAPPTPSSNDSGPDDEDPIVIDDPDKPWTQGVSAEDRRAARDLFLEGNRRFRIPLFAKAAEKYAAALAKWKHPGFYFNLAVAQLNLGQEVEARENLERALKHGESPLGAEQFQEAQRQLREVERQLGRIRVSCPTQGAVVTLDGVKLFTGPGSYEGWAKATRHEITAKKAGYLSEARQVAITSGQLLEIEFELITLSEATDASRRWAVWKPWAVVAAGGVIAGASAGLHRRAFMKFEAYDDRFQGQSCAQGTPPPGCPEEMLDPQLRLARRDQVVAAGGYIVGGSLIATGVVLLYLNRPRLKEETLPSFSAKSLAVTPVVSADALGIRVIVSH